MFLYQILLILLLIPATPLTALFPPPPAPEVGLPFLSGSELHKKQLVEREKIFDQTKKSSEQAIAQLIKANNELAVERDEIKKQIDVERNEETSVLLNKRLTILNNRQQNIILAQDTWKAILETEDKLIKQIKEIIEFLQTGKPEFKFVYSWKEFIDAQSRATELQIKVEMGKARREEIKKQSIAEKETIIFLQKQIEVKTKELEKISETVQDPEKLDQGKTSTLHIKLEADALREELSRLQARVETCRLIVIELDTKYKLAESESEFLRYRLNTQLSMLSHIEGHLVIDQSNIEAAKENWKSETQKALKTKEAINQLRETKKNEKTAILSRLEVLKDRQDALKANGENKTLQALLVKARYKKEQALLALLERELQILDAKKELSDIGVMSKELMLQMVDLRYKISRKDERDILDEVLPIFKNQRDIAINTLKSLKDSGVSAWRNNTNLNDMLKTFEAKLADTDYEHELNGNDTAAKEIKRTLEQTHRNLKDHSNLTQQFLTINAETISNQEKIITQYDRIIGFLESTKATQSIWERSPKAISWMECVKALLDAESFFRNFFWDIPEYLGPQALFPALRNILQYFYIVLLIFALLFISLFLGARHLLRISYKTLQEYLNVAHPRRSRFFYFNITLSIIEFCLEHFSLLFSWLFLQTHFFLKANYLFSSMSSEIFSFYSALFYLGSIPLLLYLSQQLRNSLKELNKRLSYIFFAERFQDKFILLLSIFLNATCVLLPLRRAFLSYPSQSHFPAVIFAAYSLIIIIIIALFFNKEDVIKFIPTRHPFLLWVRRKVERNYYPVFFFVISLFILSNPYIGYSNLAWYLAFAVSTTALLINALFLVHHYIREYSVFLFMKEDDDEIYDKFEYAKTYYGFFVIFSFLALSFIAITLVARIWGHDYTVVELWRLLAQEWVISVGVDSNNQPISLGIVQFLTLALFITIGFLSSSLVNKFILNKLFEILRTEPGTQNTVSRIFHYALICFAIMLGFMVIKQVQFIMYVAGLLIVGIGFALKDVASDIFAGFIVLLERPIEIGNFVKIGDIIGTVRKISARSTIIVTARNATIIISNKDLLSKPIINWGQSRFAMGLEIFVRVDQDADTELVKQLLITAAQNHPLILRVPNILVRFDSFEPDCLLFLLRPFISSRRVIECFIIESAIRMEIVKLFREHGIKLAKPQRVLHHAPVYYDPHDPSDGAIEIKGPDQP